MTNSFGFGAALAAGDGLDLPVTPKKVDRVRREEGREVAAEAGFHRRSPVQRAPKASEGPSKAIGRVRLNEAAPRQNLRYAGEARVQLNIQTPVPVAEAWRSMMDAAPVNQWELLEVAVPLLRKHFGLDDSR